MSVSAGPRIRNEKKFSLFYLHETLSWVIMIIVIAAHFVCTPPSPLPPSPPAFSTISPVPIVLSWVLLCWFLWWVAKINIKIRDMKVAYWFKKSQYYSHYVSAFDLWPVFKLFDDKAPQWWWPGMTVDLSFNTHRPDWLSVIIYCFMQIFYIGYVFITQTSPFLKVVVIV